MTLCLKVPGLLSGSADVEPQLWGRQGCIPGQWEKWGRGSGVGKANCSADVTSEILVTGGCPREGLEGSLSSIVSPQPGIRKYLGLIDIVS